MKVTELEHVCRIHNAYDAAETVDNMTAVTDKLVKNPKTNHIIILRNSSTEIHKHRDTKAQ